MRADRSPGPPWRRIAVAVVLAPLLQVAVLGRPDARPDAALLVAVVAGTAAGPVAGAAAGFATGLVADLVPPALPPAGRTALLLCLLGHACGLLPRRLHPLARVLLGTATGTVAVAGASGLTGAAPGPEPAVLLCNLIAAPLLWRLLTWRRRATSGHHFDATLVPLPTAAGAPAGGRVVPHPARPVVAGADPGRRALHPGRRRRPRTPGRRPGRARAHPR
ncbi:hypothetical protein [Nonomuraea sp. NPDC050783]|uniref:hypothetical protein n=1 Tax=Nonomuraea sp. NPDC050783 TaxID=3154634 RepID=UPI0034654DA2